jgi:hypothetical protein
LNEEAVVLKLSWKGGVLLSKVRIEKEYFLIESSSIKK